MQHDPGPLVDALEANATLPLRLQAYVDALPTILGARGAGLAIELVGGVPLTLVGGDLSAERVLELAASGSQRAKIGPHGWLVAEAPEDPSALAFAARLLALDLTHALSDLRRASSDFGIAFISHQMGNRLMPLLCNEAVANEAKRFRGLIDQLRHLRGRIMLRDLFALPTFLETIRSFLRHRRSGAVFDLHTSFSDAAAALTIGPEQTGLLPELLHLGYLTRGLAASGSPVQLGAVVGAEGTLELTFELTLADPRDAVGLCALTCPPGSEPILELERDGDGVRVGFRLNARPSVVVFDTAPSETLVGRLAAAGLEIRRASTPEEALAEASRPPQPWVVLVAGEAWPAARVLKRQLAIQVPALSMRCYRLDDNGAPVGYEVESPGQVDLRALLRGDGALGG